jgi:hypothetical protein
MGVAVLRRNVETANRTEVESASRRYRENRKATAGSRPADCLPGIERVDFRGQRSQEVMIETRMVELDRGIGRDRRKGGRRQRVDGRCGGSQRQ